VYFFFASSSSFSQSASASPSFFLARRKSCWELGGLAGKLSGFDGMAAPTPLVLSFLISCFFWTSNFFTGSFKRFASWIYSFHESVAMYSFTSASHEVYCSFRFFSYSSCSALPSFENSCLNCSTSALAAFAFFAGIAPSTAHCALRFSCTKTEKPDFGGCAGASLRNFSVMTFMASAVNSCLALLSFFSNPLYCSDSLYSSTSFSHFSRSAFAFCSYSAFVSAESSSHFAFRAEMPFPSPLPCGTSDRCSRA